MPKDNLVTRAFELARAGACCNTKELRRRLERECYNGVSMHLDSRSLKKQLTALMKAAPSGA